MNIYEKKNIGDILAECAYPGRGIVTGLSENGRYAAFAYFIMGRSGNSRNRVFRSDGETVTIYPFDESKVSDPSLIIYSPVRKVGNRLVVTNGDQTDTVCSFLERGSTFEAALETREFEPDAPNFTPRISAMLDLGKDFSYRMSILKSADENGSACCRFTYVFSGVPGLGHFIHTYAGDGNPLPTFSADPERVTVPDSADELFSAVWENLNEENKISLVVRYTDLETGETEERLVNKNA